jgi:hypothetical protein
MFMKTSGKSRIGILVAVVVLLFSALAVGIGIKMSQPHLAEFEPQVEQQQTKPAKTRSQEESKLSEMTAEDEEFVQWLDEEIKRFEEEEETEAMPEKEQMYVSQEHAEVSSLKDSMSWAEFKAAFKEGRKKEKKKKQKGKTDWARNMSMEELHKVRWEIEEYIEKLRAKGVTNPKKYEGAFKKMEAVEDAMWEKENSK